MTAAPDNQPQERVLATLNVDGSRRWLRPRVSPGRFLTARRMVAYGLIAIFTVIPWVTIGGVPVLRADLPNRRFAVFGHIFFPTDTVLMALLFISIFLGIFFITALFGRVWCGWACPQTVYMEFLFRPIERLIEGAPGRKRKIEGATGVRKALKYLVFLIASLVLAHTFLAYFVDPVVLLSYIRHSPMEHPTPFLVVMVTTALMMFDFAFFREQTCLVACPYGRFQAAMLDRNSMIVAYDRRRGEPRSKKRRSAEPPTGDIALRVVPDAPAQGDCIDCKMCVTTCPTGIDIREGLQMECIGCAQCIDACDAVMDKVGRPRGLVRYASQNMLEGKAKSILRPRMFLYPTIIAVLLTIFVFLLTGRAVGEAAILPRQGAPFYTLESGEISNQVRLRMVNRGTEPAEFRVAVGGHDNVRLIVDWTSVTLKPNESTTVGVAVALPADAFDARGRCPVEITVSAPEFTKSMEYLMLGPTHTGPHEGSVP
jgi:cytochrome c oxidase accessory protein FixG